jgi:hypothetical protein
VAAVDIVGGIWHFMFLYLLPGEKDGMGYLGGIMPTIVPVSTGPAVVSDADIAVLVIIDEC